MRSSTIVQMLVTARQSGGRLSLSALTVMAYAAGRDGCGFTYRDIEQLNGVSYQQAVNTASSMVSGGYAVAVDGQRATRMHGGSISGRPYKAFMLTDKGAGIIDAMLAVANGDAEWRDPVADPSADPIAECRAGRPARGDLKWRTVLQLYGIDALPAGGSVWVPMADARSARASAYAYGKRHGKRYSVRKEARADGALGYRITCVESTGGPANDAGDVDDGQII